MTISSIEFNRTSRKNIIINIFKLAIMYNALNLGWQINQIDYKTFEFTKHYTNSDIHKYNNFDLTHFINYMIN